MQLGENIHLEKLHFLDMCMRIVEMEIEVIWIFLLVNKNLKEVLKEVTRNKKYPEHCLELQVISKEGHQES